MSAAVPTRFGWLAIGPSTSDPDWGHDQYGHYRCPVQQAGPLHLRHGDSMTTLEVGGEGGRLPLEQEPQLSEQRLVGRRRRSAARS